MIYLDIETYSELDLPKVDTYRYARECEIMLVSWCVDDGPVQTLHSCYLLAAQRPF